MPGTYRKKLIEVALPLEAINAASAREKSIRHGHPSTLHLWWARRPLATARAVIFAQMVDDPSSRPELFPTEETQDAERQRLFRIIERLVQWENTTNEAVIEEARAEIRKSWRLTCDDNKNNPRAAELFNPDKLPAFHDPFAGGGALPLEAQRLGMEAYASDLNPVAVLINKAMIEIPPKFAGQAPVNPEARKRLGSSARWKGASGLAEDVRYYGQWMRDEAEKRIGHLYPQVEVTAEMARERPDLRQYVGKKLTVIAWIWARTVKSPNPAFSHVDVPLASTFMLSTKSGKEAYVEPVIENGGYRFAVKIGRPRNPGAAKDGTSAGKRAGFRCLVSGTPLTYEYIRKEGQAGRIAQRLMAIVAEGDRGRIYIEPDQSHASTVSATDPYWKPEVRLEGKCRVNVSNYGIDTYGDLFTPRQLVALTTFSDLVGEARELIREHAAEAGLADDGRALRDGGTGATAYAEAVSVYLGLLVDQQSNQSSTICGWNNINQQMIVTFSRQAIPMVWDFAECNVFSTSTGSLWNLLERQVKGIASLSLGAASGQAFQDDAEVQKASQGKVVATDPPYYDNIGYADLSDFFYVWLRRSISVVYPELFTTIAVPKVEELIASSYRHASKEEAEKFFLEGMTGAMQRLFEQSHPAFPVTIYYAFKQSETQADGNVTRTGWETFLDAVIKAGFSVGGTWPMKTESANKLKATVAALASSIVLVCWKRPETTAMATRGEFLAALRNELRDAIRTLQSGNIAPVDLDQSSIGPGMAIFTRYARVLEPNGKTMTVATALAAINDVLDEVRTEAEGEYDPETRFAVRWFEDNGMRQGKFGEADNMARARNTAVNALERSGIVTSSGGNVRLLRSAELAESWTPASAGRVTVWEATQRLILAHDSGGVDAAGRLVALLGGELSSRCKDLAYRLYAICESKRWAEDAVSYNGLVAAWPEILAAAENQRSPVQGTLA